MNKLNKNISRIKTFFRSRGVTVKIAAISDKHHKGNNSHTIDCVSAGQTSIATFDYLIDCIFPTAESTSAYRYAVFIDEAFIICRDCGCSDHNACLGGCGWVEEDLCSSCVIINANKKKSSKKSTLAKLLNRS